ncbi:MAG: multicopper oxidase domain-containing protein [Deltaproteobacteria bacterium]|nr:multicopper oxidase domain-containing protein [Deltaproteobacteria bacterium]
MTLRELRVTRRDMLRWGIMAGGATLIGRRAWAECLDQTPIPIHEAMYDCGVGGEPFPTSPFILEPFNDPLPIPTALARGWRRPDGTLDPFAADAWTVRESAFGPGVVLPGPGEGHQDALGHRYNGPGIPFAGTHQLWTDGTGVSGLPGTQVPGFPLPNPILYHIRLQVRTHSFTSSPVMPIDKNGNPVAPPPDVVTIFGKYYLPPSAICGFNGTFPGPLINAEYGRPVLVRFENDLDFNPLCLDRQDFGAPDWAFLTHLHNGHTAPESDGQPHHLTDNDGGYLPGQWSDNLYLMYPAGNDPAEIQSFLWFHDHRMHHTGANVYKGMVGLMPHYDPVLDPGDERARFGKHSKALGLPGIRTDNPDGTFDVKYDIPLALYDWCADDGVTEHRDIHTPPEKCGQTHPEWWGQSFFRHYPNHGFVGDIFTVNGVAFPVLHVYRRKYRLRFLGASIARIYQLWLMQGTPQPAPGSQGQWQLPDGQQCMRFTQIASEGGLLPKSIVRDSFEIWPAKRREFVVDFTQYMDKSPTSPGDVIYLVNTLEMPTGRKPRFPFDADFVPTGYRVPMLKIVIDGDPPEPDYSQVPNKLRDMPGIPNKLDDLPHRLFRLERGGGAPGEETEWLINGQEFDPLNALALPVQGNPEVWTVENGSGGWVHPMHMHQEEHTTLSRNGVKAPDELHPDDTGKEDVVALYPNESVTFYRNFRTFKGKYVAHCHNLAHEDHNMMFGWTIV